MASGVSCTPCCAAHSSQPPHVRHMCMSATTCTPYVHVSRHMCAMPIATYAMESPIATYAMESVMYAIHACQLPCTRASCHARVPAAIHACQLSRMSARGLTCQLCHVTAVTCHGCQGPLTPCQLSCLPCWPKGADLTPWAMCWGTRGTKGCVCVCVGDVCVCVGCVLGMCECAGDAMRVCAGDV